MKTAQTQNLISLLQQRIVILDGAMGTMIQRHKLTEGDYRGSQFEHWASDLKGNNDLLSITQPEIISSVHLEYLQAGADIIETNTFNAQAVSLADYDMQNLATEFNVASVNCAKKAIADFRLANPTAADKPLFIAGAIGPMNKTLSLSPDVNRPGYRAVDFDEVAEAYYEQVSALVTAGADILLVETIFDTLNAKAAIFAIKEFFHKNPQFPELPIMISGTITDASGRTLSGQTLEAFLISVMHANPLSIGLNCALGAADMRPYIQELAGLAPCYVSCYPNAGLPNVLGEYDETPEQTAAITTEFAAEGWINILGGCCGTTPDHIRAMGNAVASCKPRELGAKPEAILA